MDLCQLIGDSIGDIRTSGGAGIGAEDDAVSKGNGHTGDGVRYHDRLAGQAIAEQENGRPTWMSPG